MGAYLLRIPFTVRSESPLAVSAAWSYVFGFGMAKYEQGASLIHSSSLKRKLLAAVSGATQQQDLFAFVLCHGCRADELRLRLISPP